MFPLHHRIQRESIEAPHVYSNQQHREREEPGDGEKRAAAAYQRLPPTSRDQSDPRLKIRNNSLYVTASTLAPTIPDKSHQAGAKQ